MKLALGKNPILSHLLLDLQRRHLLASEVFDDMKYLSWCSSEVVICASLQEASKKFRNKEISPKINEISKHGGVEIVSWGKERCSERGQTPRHSAPPNCATHVNLHKQKQVWRREPQISKDSELEAAEQPLKLPHPVKMGSGSSKPATAPSSQVWTR